jgi:hypothetical protein
MIAVIAVTGKRRRRMYMFAVLPFYKLHKNFTHNSNQAIPNSVFKIDLSAFNKTYIFSRHTCAMNLALAG